MFSEAENQGKVKFSYKKYYSFRNSINTKFSERFHSDMQIDYVSRVLFYGDTQPAIVISVDPLLIAAYSDEMDAVVMLRFPGEFVQRYNLTIGSRLITSNAYFEGKRVASDIFIGEFYSKQYADFMPIVQLFLGKQDDKICEKIPLFNEEIWGRLSDKANEYIALHPNLSRDGFFYFKK